MPWSLRAFCTLALAAGLPLNAQTVAPDLSGLVTDPGSPQSFTVNSVHVLCNAGTINLSMSGEKAISLPGCPQRLLGESVQVFGKENRRAHTIIASRIENDVFKERKVAGLSIIDRMPPRASADAFSVRADGYLILITPSTKSSFQGSLKSTADVTTNVWIQYQGRQRRDGKVTADTAIFTPNIVQTKEATLKKKTEFDPTAVTEKDRQSALSKDFLGMKAKKIPAYPDKAMQQRVEALGNQLIPAYQKALANDDPTRIQFRFQVVDERTLHDALSLPNGIILVPYQLVKRLQNDSQLAALLADNIACTLEKQMFRSAPAEKKVTALEVASGSAIPFVPGVPLFSLAAVAMQKKILTEQEKQSGRVSLDLLSDAGFDPAQAPLTWWLLASSKPEPTARIKMPYRAQYLYSFLAATWQLPGTEQSASSAQPSPQSASLPPPASVTNP